MQTCRLSSSFFILSISSFDTAMFVVWNLFVRSFWGDQCGVTGYHKDVCPFTHGSSHFKLLHLFQPIRPYFWDVTSNLSCFWGEVLSSIFGHYWSPAGFLCKSFRWTIYIEHFHIFLVSLALPYSQLLVLHLVCIATKDRLSLFSLESSISTSTHWTGRL